MRTGRILVLVILLLSIFPSMAMARYYNPQTGRYLTPDPIGLAGGINPYVYVGNDPVNLVDPLGLYTEIIGWDPVGIKYSSFGHVSADINGRNYSFGPGGWDKTYPNAADYIARQLSFRGGSGVQLGLSPNQEAWLENCLRSKTSPYVFPENSCGIPIQSCLHELGVVFQPSFLPPVIIENLKRSPNATGRTEYLGPRIPNREDMLP